MREAIDASAIEGVKLDPKEASAIIVRLAKLGGASVTSPGTPGEPNSKHQPQTKDLTITPVHTNAHHGNTRETPET